MASVISSLAFDTCIFRSCVKLVTRDDTLSAATGDNGMEFVKSFVDLA